MSSKVTFVIFIVTISMLRRCDSFPDRVPVTEYPEICQSMFPIGHNTTEQDSETPYRIITNTNNCYSGQSQPIYVTVYHMDEGGIYEGLFVAARDTIGSTESFGTFDPNGDVQLSALSCGGKINNTIGHNQHDHYTQQVFKWTPPAGFTQDIQFVATMVRRVTTFWLNVKSPVLQYKADCTEFAVTNPSLIPSTSTVRNGQTTSGAGAYMHGRGVTSALLIAAVLYYILN